MRGDRVTIPPMAELPGPKPASKEIYEQYTALIKCCMDPMPAKRPNFMELTQKLKALAAEEKIEQGCRNALCWK